jgi:hypothetical protein
MNDNESLERIRKKLSSAQGITSEEAEFLMKRISELEKKSSLLSQHVLELTEELENTKMDFGGGAR